MRWNERRERFRAILEGKACIHPASVFDPVSARIAADLGFELGMFAGSVASLVVLGAPDLTLITLTEFAEQAHRICRAGELPLLVDADHGYGNALNVMRTVQELETAGIAALTIEDTDHTEQRFVSLCIDPTARVLVVVFTLRGDALRIISARPATRTEIRSYEGAT